GGVKEYVGGYDDWLRQRSQARSAPAAPAGKPTSPTKSTPSAEKGPGSKRRRSFKEKQELAALPAKIASLEREIESLHTAMTAPEFYRQGGDTIAQHQAQLKSTEEQVAAAYHRWEELEQLA